jgi:hypothetical protein
VDPVTRLGNDDRISRFNSSRDRFHPAENDCTRANAFPATPITEVRGHNLMAAAVKEAKKDTKISIVV